MIAGKRTDIPEPIVKAEKALGRAQRLVNISGELLANRAERRADDQQVLEMLKEAVKSTRERLAR
jgi:hypothetical protein